MNGKFCGNEKEHGNGMTGMGRNKKHDTLLFPTQSKLVSLHMLLIVLEEKLLEKNDPI